MTAGAQAVTPLAAWVPSPTEDPLGYPGRIPKGSYVLVNSAVVMVDGSAADLDERLGAHRVEQRTPVLAVGSNAAPARLAEKAGEEPVAVIGVTVIDHSVVYSAHIARYGSIAATLHPDPGASCRLHVCLFTTDQLATVDRSEGNYARVAMSPDSIVGLDPVIPSPVQRYASRWGALSLNGGPVRVAEVEGAGSRLVSATQAEVQARLRARFGDRLPGDDTGGATMAALLAAGTVSQTQINRWLATVGS